MVDKLLSSYPELVVTHLLGHDSANLVGKIAIADLPSGGGGGGSGTPGGTAGQLQYNNTTFGGFGYWNGSSTLSLGNATTPQTLKIYNTYAGTLAAPTSATWLEAKWLSGTMELRTIGDGDASTAAPLHISTGGYWQMTLSGAYIQMNAGLSGTSIYYAASDAFTPSATNTLDLGRTGTRFKTVYAGNYIGANFSSIAQGLTPPSGGGATNFLRADGTWVSPGGGAIIADIAPNPLTTPPGSLFWESDTGAFYVLYDDGSIPAWVGITDGTSGGGGGPTITPQKRFLFDSAAAGTLRFGDTVIASEFDNHYSYTGPAPTGFESIGPSFYTVADPSTSDDNHAASYNGVSGTVYSTSTTVTCNLVGGNFTAYRSGGSANPIVGVSGAAVLGDAAIGGYGGDGGAGGFFHAWANSSAVSGASGTEAFEIDGAFLAGKVIGAYARSWITTTYALINGISIGVLGISQVESNAANSIGGWFGANSHVSVGDVGNRFGVLIDDISGAKNLNMALRTGLGAVQFGGKVAAPSGFVGDVTLAQIGTTTISSVHTGCLGKYSFTDSGTKTYTYKVVPVFAGGVTGPASAAVTTALGFDNLATDEQNNLVTFAPVEGAVGGYDIYRTVAGGTTTNTTGKIGNCPQHITRALNNNALEPTAPSFVDIGQVGDGSTPPATDTSGVVTATRFVGANFTSALQGLAPASGGGTANFLRADGTWAAAGGGSIAPLVIVDADNVHQRNGANEQHFRVYQSYTDASNGLWLEANWAAGTMYLRTIGNGTGAGGASMNISSTGASLILGGSPVQIVVGTTVYYFTSVDFMCNAADASIDLGRSGKQWKTVFADNHSTKTKAGTVVAGDIPDGTWAVIRDTSGATTKLYYNNAGTLMSVALT